MNLPSAGSEVNLRAVLEQPRVFLFTDSDQFAGTERHLVDLEKGLRRWSVPVVVVCPPGTPLEDSVLRNGGRVRTLRSKGRHLAEALWSVRRWVNQREVDILHVHNGRTALLGALAMHGTGLTALMASQHFIDPARTQRRGWVKTFLRPLHAWVESQVDTWICVSEAVRSAMQKRGEGEGSHVFTVRHGIDESSAGSDWPGSPLDPSAFHLVCVARLAPEKGHQTLLQAVARLPERHSTLVHLHLLGDGPLRGALGKECRALGIDSRVHFLGHQPNPDPWMRAADAVVLASPAEPFGLVLLEAMRVSKPVIAARGGGAMEIVQDQRTGLLFEPQDSGDLASKLEQLVSDEALRVQLGRAGYWRWRSEFSLETLSARMASLYAWVWSRRSSARRGLR